MAEKSRSFCISVPITAPFEGFEKPGEVKLHDGDLTYVKLRPGSFSRKESIFSSGHKQWLQHDMMRIKNVRAVGTDIIITLANLRSYTVSIRKSASWQNNLMGPAYGIMVLKDFLSSKNPPESADFYDHSSEKVVFIPVPQSFSRFVVLDDHILVSNKDYFAAYNRHDGKLGYTNYEKPTDPFLKSNKMFHSPLFTSDGFFIGTSFFKTTWELKWFDCPEGQLVETDWTVKRYRVDKNGGIEDVGTVVSMTCHQASEKLKDELTFVWMGKLVYPTISRINEPVTIMLKSYQDSVIHDAHARVLQEFQLPIEAGLNHRTATIEEVKEFPTCLGFHINTGRSGESKKLIIINKDSKSIVRWFDLDSLRGYDKHIVTKTKIFIGLAKTTHEFTDGGKNKGLDYEIRMSDLQEGNGALKTVYKGEGLNFTVDYKMDDLLVIHKNFDEVSLLQL